MRAWTTPATITSATTRGPRALRPLLLARGRVVHGRLVESRAGRRSDAVDLPFPGSRGGRLSESLQGGHRPDSIGTTAAHRKFPLRFRDSRLGERDVSRSHATGREHYDRCNPLSPLRAGEWHWAQSSGDLPPVCGTG